MIESTRSKWLELPDRIIVIDQCFQTLAGVGIPYPTAIMRISSMPSPMTSGGLDKHSHQPIHSRRDNQRAVMVEANGGDWIRMGGQNLHAPTYEGNSLISS